MSKSNTTENDTLDANLRAVDPSWRANASRWIALHTSDPGEGGTGYLSNTDIENLVDGVWNAATSDYSTAGTTGKALTDAGSAGNPWSADPSVNNDPNTFGELIQRTEIKVDDATALIITK